MKMTSSNLECIFPRIKGLIVRPLPPLHIQEHLAETYFANCHVPYIVLHKPSFMKQIADGTVAPALLLAVCAVSARYSIPSNWLIIDSPGILLSSNIRCPRPVTNTLPKPANFCPSNSTDQHYPTFKPSLSSGSTNSDPLAVLEHGCMLVLPFAWPSVSD